MQLYYMQDTKRKTLRLSEHLEQTSPQLQTKENIETLKQYINAVDIKLDLHEACH